jgi:tRNA pseudouridine13 synthase
VHPARRDELNRGRLKLHLSFTLPPGAYATLVVRRVFWFAAEGARPVRPAAQPIAAQRAAAQRAAERDERARAPQGFLARQRARKEARAARREAARNKPTSRR